MKISPVNISRINFGYDKALNKELKERLKTCPNTMLASTISSLNNQCNSLENKIRKCDTESNLDDFIDIFLTLKQVLTSYVSITFENLKYADREYKHYNDEFQKSPDDNKNLWLKDVCGILSDWVTFDIPKDKTKKTSQETAQSAPQAESQNPVKKEEDCIDAHVSKIKSITSKAKALEVFVPTEDTPKGFGDVAGMDKVKEELSDGVLQLINNPKQAQLDYEEYGKKVPRCILLYGPPGCGKTYITQALAQEAGVPLFMLSISNTGSMFVNMTSKNIQKAFDEALDFSKEIGKPCLLFMDEVDTLGFNRDSESDEENIKQVGTLLQAMDKAKNNGVIIIGATNKYNLLDPAVKRRFDAKTFISVPDFEARKALLLKLLSPRRKAQNLLADKNSLDEISALLEGFSNDSICKITSEASRRALKRDRSDISMADFQAAIKETTEEKPNIKEYKAENSVSAVKIGF